MTVEELLTKWNDTTLNIIHTHKKVNYDLALATASYGLDVDTSCYALTNKFKLNKIVNKWDSMFDSFLDRIDILRYHDNAMLKKVVDNFGKKFYTDLNKEFPKRNFIKL